MHRNGQGVFAGLSGRWLGLVLYACLALVPAHAATAGGSATQSWLLVDTRKLTLTVFVGGQAQITLRNIAIGRYGASADKMHADNTTPLGRFHVTRIRRDSGFHRFIELDYPDVERAERAYQQGAISQRELQEIVTAHRRGKAPPQDTALGGHIGIHGLGQGDPRLHETLNWTRGCVALTDEQLDAVLRWVRTGITVEIR
ncbi:MAG: L,D-transpeptidase [Chromatiaceae bacterium]|jgi:hypothetical protein|nr:L,D-transpeptidase [Chromatiaceae bacterium]